MLHPSACAMPGALLEFAIQSLVAGWLFGAFVSVIPDLVKSWLLP